MKFTVAVVFLVLHVGATLGVEPNALDKAMLDVITACVNIRYNSSVCSDHDAEVRCLQKLIDDTKKNVTGVIDFVTKENMKCPALRQQGTCLYQASQKCMELFFSWMKVGDRQTCNEIPKARECLLQLNKTCTGEEIGMYMKTLNEVNTQCHQGLWNNGPCSYAYITGCAYAVEMDVKSYGINEETQFNCKPVDVLDSKRCLMNMKLRCTKDFEQAAIMEKMTYLDKKCSSANNNNVNTQHPV